jgi:hypothetical protein
MINNGWTRDLLSLSNLVSDDNNYFFEGTCGNLTAIKTCDMYEPYYTRMRIYKNDNTSVIVFRPTQSNGGEIHNNRYLTSCTFLNNLVECGSVHNHFQEAFMYMENECKDAIEEIRNTTIYITGHSLGGAFSLFMTAKLYYDYHIIPKVSYGFAGPFIGDGEYTRIVQDPLKQIIDIKQVEVIDINNYDNRDKTCEVYNTYDNGIYIDPTLLCGFYINPLPIDPSRSDPNYTYGLHDLKNYRLLCNSMLIVHYLIILFKLLCYLLSPFQNKWQ